MLDYGSGEQLYWDSANQEVRFTVAQDWRKLVCRISTAALDRYTGEGAEPDDYIRAAQEHFRHITHRISDKLSLGLTEADGSVLIRARDW